MGLLDRLLPKPFEPLTTPSSVVASQPRHRFSQAVGSDFSTWQALIGTAEPTRVSRVLAQCVPAITRARDVFASLGTLPLHAVNSSGEQVIHKFLEQPESLSGLVRSVTMARTIEDLFYDGTALWQVIQRDVTTNFPTVVERCVYGTWSQDPTTGAITVGGQERDSSDLVLFTSPNVGILTTGAKAIRALVRMELTASMYADSPEAAEFFQATEGQEPEDSDVQDFLDAWRAARQSRTSGYIPSGIERHEVARMTPEELQLITAREFAVSEVSRLTGIAPSWLSLNTTTRTYSNMQDERRDFTDTVAAPYLRCTEERLSLGDCTPRGTTVKWNLDGYLRANTAERYASYTAALAGGWLTVDEIRALEDRPPLGGSE